MNLLEDTDWTTLLHAYGRATDTPGHLRALIGDDDLARGRALEHLGSAILHQGTPWTATAPVARFVAAHLGDPQVDPIRPALLTFLGGVIAAASDADPDDLEPLAAFDLDPWLARGDDDALYEDEDAANALYARSVLGCVRVLDELVDAILAPLADPDPRTRTRAAEAAVGLALAGAAVDRAALTRRLVALAQAGDPDERCAHVLALGTLGAPVDAFLADPSPAVRACAALAPGTVGPAGVEALLQALEREDVDRWFVERPPQFRMSPRFAIVAAVLDRVAAFDEVVEAAIAVVRTTVKYRADGEWGPLLAAAFATSPGQVTTAAQRRYLAALVEREELWDPAFGNASRWFRSAGLPYDRAACAALAGGSS